MTKRNTIKIATAAAAAALLIGADASAYTLEKKIGDVDTKLDIYGFAQIEARGGDGNIKDDQDASVKFAAQRVRLGWNYTAGLVRAKVFMDFNQDSEVNAVNGDVGLPKNIKDAFIALRFDKAFVPKFGLIKMPHGMGFTIPGWNLDIVERSGLDKGLVLERNMGFMISGRDMFLGNNGKVNGFEMGHERPWKGFGYDIMIGNQAGRSKAVTNVKPGDANSYAARVMFDYTELLHLEASYALSEKAGGIEGHIDKNGVPVPADTEDYSSYDIGLDSHFADGANFKAEYITGHNIQGVKDWDQEALALTGTYAINEYIEPAIKYYQAHSEKNGADADLSNTYIGVNLYVSPFDNKMDRSSKRKRNAHRIQLNYIIANGDTDTWAGIGGYKDDAWVVQAQYKF